MRDKIVSTGNALPRLSRPSFLPARNVMIKISCALACLALAPAAFAKPQDVSLRFGMTFAGIPIAEVTDTLSFSEDGYSIESLSVAVGLGKVLNHPGVDRFSVGKIGDDGSLLMEEFVDVRGEKVRKTKMDHATGEVSWLSDKGEPGSDSSEGKAVYNALTVVYTPYATGVVPSDGSAFMTTGRRFYSFNYSVVEEKQKMKVKAGEFDVWRQDRLDDSGSRKHSVWFAPELGNLPVKIWISGNGGAIEMQLAETSFIPAKN